MAARQVAILHGWSDTSRSFKPLAQFLRDNGYEAVPLWLGDYISTDDDVRIEDVAKRMHEVVREKMAGGGLANSFDLIAHSTGGLVARQWIADYYPDGASCPVKRLIMLAPANFGSRLASSGQSLLGRVVKGWRNWFQTGKEMLQSLELASQFQWDLAKRDLFSSRFDDVSPYGAQGVWPFVITGSHPYASGLRQIVNEHGSDGTIRAAAANLNARGVTIDFASNEVDPPIRNWALRHGELMFPFAVLPDRTHSSIVNPGKPDVNASDEATARLGELLLSALRCPNLSHYERIADSWDEVSDQTARLARDDDLLADVFPEQRDRRELQPYFHQYFQAITLVVDDHGTPVDDYFLEFHAPEPSTRESAYFQSEVLEHVHTHSTNSAARCLYVDRNDLMENYYDLIQQGDKKVMMSITAAPPGDNIVYFGSERGRRKKHGAAGELQVHAQADGPYSRWMKRNCTHFIKIIIPRTPDERVFRLKQA